MRTVAPSFATLMLLTTLAAGSDAQEGREQSDALEVRTASGTALEELGREQLLRLVATYDVERWIYTRVVQIQSRVTPHSHPVLTLNTQYIRNDTAQLATFLHEQLHWYVSELPDTVVEAAKAELRRLYPDAPARGPEGARDLESTYLHLIVCTLELEATAAVFGREVARRTLEGWDHYTWVYRTVLADGEPLVALLARHGLDARGRRAPERGSELSPEARSFLSAALDTLEAVTLGRDTIPWRVLRDSAFSLAAGAQKASDTYGALGWALRRANKHSFLQAPSTGAVSELVRGAFGYIHIPQRGGAAVALADSLHGAIRTLEAAGACGWIVDLRGNGGGNMWPMLAGIGPLLGDSLVGSFGSGPAAERWFQAPGVSGIRHADGRIDTLSRVTVPVVRLRDPEAPVAILIDAGTGSSGEAVAVAFWGRPNSRSFGMRSAGFATVNRGSRLPDGANMVVTTGYYTDRRGTQHAERLQPDSLFADAPPGWPFAWTFATDRVAGAAADWLSRQPACRGRD